MKTKRGTLGEFIAWTKRVVRDSTAANGVPKRWIEARKGAVASRKGVQMAAAARKNGRG